ncbi:MAG TPA: hypothetical protein VK133_00635, partial [Amoebophilaceae bacterium]|nr:hypothetical protein [Amoebophilaceae bacterium]
LPNPEPARIPQPMHSFVTLTTTRPTGSVSQSHTSARQVPIPRKPLPQSTPPINPHFPQEFKLPSPVIPNQIYSNRPQMPAPSTFHPPPYPSCTQAYQVPPPYPSLSAPSTPTASSGLQITLRPPSNPGPCSDTYAAATFQEDMETESLQQQQAIQSIISTLEKDSNQASGTANATTSSNQQQQHQQTNPGETFTLVKRKKPKNKGK